MQHPDRDAPRPAPRSLKASVVLLMFGLGVLTFLVAIDRGHWFHLRPASGTAAAMAHAADLSRAGAPS